MKALVVAALLAGCNTSSNALDTTGGKSDADQMQAVPMEGVSAGEPGKPKSDDQAKAKPAEAEKPAAGEEAQESSTEVANIVHKAPTVTQKGTYIRALVNTIPITSYDVQRRVKFLQLRRMKSSSDAALEELVDETLKIWEARRTDMLATNGEVNAAFANFASNNKTTTERMSTELNRLGVGAEHFREFIRAQLSWNRMLGAKLRSETVQKTQGEAIFELRRAGEEKPETTEYQLQQIIFVIPEEKRKELMKVRKSEALNFKQRFGGCDASFELAKALTDVTVKSLGRVMQPELPQEWKDEVSATQIGQTTNPKETDKGVELIAVCSSKLISDDRAAQIVNQAQTFEELGKQGSKAGDGFLSELRKQATIVYR